MEHFPRLAVFLNYTFGFGFADLNRSAVFVQTEFNAAYGLMGGHIRCHMAIWHCGRPHPRGDMATWLPYREMVRKQQGTHFGPKTYSSGRDVSIYRRFAP